MENSHFIVSTREALLHHLFVKVKYLIGKSGNAEEVCQRLSENRNNEEIINLLCNCDVLKKLVINMCSNYQDDTLKESIGERLFNAVAAIDSELCAQITGMLLEMDVDQLNQLLLDSNLLKSAVTKARDEFIQFTIHKQNKQPSELDSRKVSEEKQVIGEELFEIIYSLYPTEASKLTGMLLELSLEELKILLSSPEKLKEKLDLGVQALTR